MTRAKTSRLARPRARPRCRRALRHGRRCDLDGGHGADAQHQHGAEPAKGGWLVNLAPDARPEAIQRQLRGFETTMAEVAYRYGEMYWGGIDGNWDYAAHMQENLAKALELSNAA